MALPPLATVADLTSRGMTVTADETALAEQFLTVASAAVREAARTAISQVTATTTLTGSRAVFLRLPNSPVTNVATVTLDGTTVTDWQLTAGPALWRSAGWATGDGPGVVAVTYTHGLPEIPPDIVDLVCRIAAASLVAVRAEADGSGIAASDVRSERLGDYAVTYGDDGRITDMELPDYLRDRLARRFGHGAAVVTTR